MIRMNAEDAGWDAPRGGPASSDLPQDVRPLEDVEGMVIRRGRRFERPDEPLRTGSVTLVIPTLDEVRNIGWVLERVPDVVDEIVLVDGASTDGTVAKALEVRPDLRVVVEARPGKGAALRAGFAAATGDRIVMIDADGSMDPAEITRYLALLDAGYDLVKGSRFVGDGGTADMERLRRAGNFVLRDLANGLYGTSFTDLCYGFIAFRRDRLEALALRSDGFEIEAEIVVRAVMSALRVGEVASFEAPRRHGDSHLRTWRDGTRVLRVMLHHRFRAAAAPPAARGAAARPEVATSGDLAA